MQWMPYPRSGTTYQNGRWMCTVLTGTSLNTEILELDDCQWFRNVNEQLGERERVTHVAYVPEPSRSVFTTAFD